MRRMVPVITLILVCFTVMASTPSYWFSQLQVKPDAQQAQQFWFVPGTGILFTYASNHVIINASGTNIAFATNAITAIYVITPILTNQVYSTNIIGVASTMAILSEDASAGEILME